MVLDRSFQTQHDTELEVLSSQQSLNASIIELEEGIFGSAKQ